MNTIKVIGIDRAKSVFQVCVWMNDGAIASNRKVSRNNLLNTIRQFPADTLIAMEACATSHYWGRNGFSRPGIHFVAIKTVEQQDIKALRSARQLMVEQRTAAANQARALAAEQGVEIPVGIHILQQRLASIIEDPEQVISPALR